MVDSTEVGKRIKQKRSERKMTLRDVAQKAGVSPALISDIERGRTSPTINSLSKISRALDAPIVHFIEDDYAAEVVVTTPKSRVTVISDLGDAELSSISTGFTASQLDVIEVTYQEGFISREVMVHHGEKCGLVLEGEIEVDVAGRTVRVESGSTIHFNADRPHSVANVAPGISRVIWITTPRLTTPVL
jgi:transcriptional regulator with XRE-family HTH domain